MAGRLVAEIARYIGRLATALALGRSAHQTQEEVFVSPWISILAPGFQVFWTQQPGFDSSRSADVFNSGLWLRQAATDLCRGNPKPAKAYPLEPEWVLGTCGGFFNSDYPSRWV